MGNAANDMVKECLEEMTPDSEQCICISTEAVLREMLVDQLLAASVSVLTNTFELPSELLHSDATEGRCIQLGRVATRPRHDRRYAGTHNL